MTTALERLKLADQYDDMANAMTKRKDVGNATKLHRTASRIRTSAIKSLSPRRKSARNVLRR